ncbi:hypothetical protein J4450_05145 [Candidatus Micrarchaeota archaeon]|nr:hypothetical protein [Candidatus Micrarchaeota archaeon]
MGFLEYYKEIKFSESEFTRFEKELKERYYSVERQRYKGENYIVVKKLESGRLLNYLRLALYGIKIEKSNGFYYLTFHHIRTGYLIFGTLVSITGILSAVFWTSYSNILGAISIIGAILSVYAILIGSQFFWTDSSRKKIHDELIDLVKETK